MRMIPAIILVTTLAVGCATPVYIPQGMDADKKSSHAVLRAEPDPNPHLFRFGNYAIVITYVDDRFLFNPFYLRSFPEAAYLTPGPHTIHVQFYQWYSQADACMELDAVAGESYLIRAHPMGDNVQIWLENSNTGDAVGNICGFEKPPSEKPSNHPV